MNNNRDALEAEKKEAMESRAPIPVMTSTRKIQVRRNALRWSGMKRK